ncbi:NAD(P)-dependent dehydrogenase (short-subunit alcohol dehydrogenase family) [Nocardioides zeae]|uniref:NAD(P)-dependent dehydrogenase (Short-subunit alcohol dehydrogenase family) n=2 Tax=Nocardioides zeae TaxID=1457234 RepID=A0AAJ1U6V6_9ACTN|nr:glucose 1-dehydrogenase [Nocardioides zeae]MDQ1105212.1 NAD(P)-dependent dehydrogenase (short-subunit alcohol dehydrogenase family) [Nocardioides zeae]MDR6175075.1 NAD(P)-dependent dehydrogenase (short-subunit alcohol dehydrogenase family) [Nocardioides zeae]MDR6211653.1 NAD(P)-dependent dehydrogenase (short-subunit alcohol dehydrogenase family) [Nocardioides zeae]
MTATLPLPGHPDLRDKVCLVTGASQGIGEATARYLAECGATTVLAARNLAACEDAVEDITAAGGTAVAMQLDVTDDAAVAATVAEVEARYGALHLAFNNAGTQGPAAPLHEQDDATVRQVLEVNLFGVISCLRHEVPAMLRAGGGVIVNTASVGGVIAAPGIAPYCASKHAVVGLSKSAAADYGRRGVRINVLAPGSVRTPILTDWLAEPGALEHMESLTPQGRIAEPEEIAPVVAWMLSDASSFMTGSVVTADGGYTAL